MFLDVFSLVMIAINTIVLSIIVIIAINNYMYLKIREQLLIIIVLISLDTFPSMFFIFSFVKDPKYANLRKYANLFSNFFSTVFSWITLLLLYLYFSGRTVKLRHKIIIFLISFSFALYSFWQEWNLENGKWVVNWVDFNGHYNPLGIYLFSTCTTLISIELFAISYSNYKISLNKVNHSEKIAYSINYISDLIIVIALFIFAVEILYFGKSDSFQYMIFGSLGALLKGLAFVIHPFVLSPLDINSKYLSIIDKKNTGFVIFEEFFGYEKNGKIGNSLVAMKIMLENLTKQEDIPSEFKYLNLEIIIVENEKFVIFLVCERSINPLRKYLTKLLDIAERSIPEVDLFVTNKMAFVR